MTYVKITNTNGNMFLSYKEEYEKGWSGYLPLMPSVEKILLEHMTIVQLKDYEKGQKDFVLNCEESVFY